VTISEIREVNLCHLRDEMGRAGVALTLIEGYIDYEIDLGQQAQELY
jgi:hypothetical protein